MELQKQRIKSMVEDPSWGRGIVFSYDAESKVELKTSVSVEASRLKLKKSLSKLRGQNVKGENESLYTDNEDDRYCLPYLESALFATVLEEAITKLRTLAECNTELKISHTLSNIFLLRELKFGIMQPKSQDDLDGWDLRNLDSDNNKIRKLDEDRKYITNLLVSTYLNLSLFESYKALKCHNDVLEDLDTYRIVLAEDEAKNKIMRREIYKQLRQQRNHMKSAIYDCDCTIDELKRQVEDFSVYSAVRSRYVDNWQLARTEQHTQTIRENELVPSNYVENYKLRNDHEHRVHSEIELLGNIIINETIEKVDNWMNKYDEDMDKMDLKIQIKKNDYQNMKDKRIGYEEMMEKHDLLMKEWIHFKEEREKARRYHELMTKSAIVVQAWWRGLIVRLQLGPYKVAKKKGKKK